jgi:hypothetical protein
VDRRRNPRGRVRADLGDPQDYAEYVARGYHRNRWAQQPTRIEVWSEKGTVRGILGQFSTSTA